MKMAPNPNKINRHCTERNIDLELKRLHRNKNTIADELSRFVDLDDWGIHSALVNRLQDAWWRCTIDRFASDTNKKFPRFNSRYNVKVPRGLTCSLLTGPVKPTGWCLHHSWSQECSIT